MFKIHTSYGSAPFQVLFSSIIKVMSVHLDVDFLGCLRTYFVSYSHKKTWALTHHSSKISTFCLLNLFFFKVKLLSSFTIFWVMMLNFNLFWLLVAFVEVIKLFPSIDNVSLSSNKAFAFKTFFLMVIRSPFSLSDKFSSSILSISWIY